MTEPSHEIEAYFAGTADAEQLRTIETWLQLDRANAIAFMEQVHFRQLVGQHLLEQGSEATAVLVELTQLEASADADMVTWLGELPADPASLSGHDFTVVGGYVLRKLFTNKKAMLISACSIAAVLLLALILINPFASNTPTAIAELPDDLFPLTDTPPLAATRHVATLTATHNALWGGPPAERDLFRGTALYLGDRLNLSAGFAEITTQRGTSVLIEGPCIFEFIGSNEMRVEQGRLVATVPPQARLFTIETPTAKVVDFGTNFGVNVLHDGDTEVAVFDGLVELHEQIEDSTQISHRIALSDGQASRVDSESGLDTNIQTFNSESQSNYVRLIENVTRPDILYAREVMELKPIAYWPMMGEKPLNSATIGMNDRDLTPVGEKEIDRVAGPVPFENSEAIAINGGRSFFTAGPYAADLWEGNEYSISIWVRVDERGEQNIISFVPSVQQRGGHYSTQLRLKDSGKVQHYTYCPKRLNPESDAYAIVKATSARPIDTARWVHLAATYGDGRSRLYIDGRLVAQERSKYVFENGYPTLLIGGATGYHRDELKAGDLKGAVCQLAVFNRVLTLREIKAISSPEKLKDKS